MRGISFVLLLVAAVYAKNLNGFGPYEDYEGQKIVGGTVTTIEEYPFAVVMLRELASGAFTHACGGTILNKRSVLSAAHCYGSLSSPSQWRIRVGSSFSSTGGTVYETLKIIRHPKYNSRTSDHDFAILRMTELIAFDGVTVAPAQIAGPNYRLQSNEEVWAIGWGTTASGGSVSEQLRHVQLRSVDQVICAQRYADIGLLVTNNMMCSGLLDVGGADQCQGDSGGPLIHKNVIVGVCSWGRQCALAYYPGINAKVSAASNWIVQNG